MGLTRAAAAPLAPSYYDPGLFVYGAHGHILVFSIGHDGVHLALVGLHSARISLPVARVPFTQSSSPKAHFPAARVLSQACSLGPIP